ncbi:MAG TPA: ribosome biogenesis GTPase Der [bacterium]|nr:ribosome biogenesis GTPase Der [bacterium]
MKPIVAIVGRPNVGKSTLFNRLVGGHRAITLDEPGVTRDRHYGHAHWDAREFVVVDTGGLFLDEQGKGAIEDKIREQVDLAIGEADVILFVMDAREGLLPDEAEIAQYLRRSGKRVFFVANKIDGPKNEETLTEFFSLGEDVLPVSAEHGYKVNDLLDRVVAPWPKLEEEVEDTAPKPIRLSVIGRPNVGKSSLLNRLLGEDRLVVHDAPGTTRDAIDTPVTVDGRDYLLIDTAGIRRRGTWASKVERYSVLNSLKAIERSDVCLLVLDATEGIHKQDAHVAGYAQEARRGVVVLWNKWDLIPAKDRKSFFTKYEDELPFFAHAPVLAVSAKTGEGCDTVWPAVNRLYDACGLRVPTSDVNRAFEGLIGAHNPPVFKGKPVKFFYATQTGVRPPTFIIFVSEPKGVHFSFKRYLANGFRRTFNFGGAPIEILFRRKRR